MLAIQPDFGIVRRPARLLTQNSEMKQIGVWNWSLPAWAGRLADGRTNNTCPSAGICALVGVPANRIPAYLKRLAGRRFSEWQAEVDAERANRRHLRLVVDNTPPSAQQPAATNRAPSQVDQPRAA
ncbi:hypothetical protein LWC34_54080 [Kibdelosporangium philippinense]|uniref:Uncharacterized protein n=1 Tax=Kibdelosporangium philippinense TaxID=211113 RepID=A0ABS8ZVG2_9PSEU|nr:hypothetical protein [Kibdelosporangium philippinense]MCE7011687.1 hypothetical protein [Kibdelosporangium philippinense]